MFDSILQEEDFNVYFNLYKVPVCCFSKQFYSIQINDHEYAFFQQNNQIAQIQTFQNDNYKQIKNIQIETNQDINQIHQILNSLVSVYQKSLKTQKFKPSNYLFLVNFAQQLAVQNPFDQQKAIIKSQLVKSQENFEELTNDLFSSSIDDLFSPPKKQSSPQIVQKSKFGTLDEIYNQSTDNSEDHNLNDTEHYNLINKITQNQKGVKPSDLI